MIIKNLFGGKGDDDKNQRKASTTKFCGICQEPFQKGKDNVRLAHCNDCNVHNRHLDASHWKQVFASKKTNSLSPDMQKLAAKLAENRSLLEGQKMTRAAGEVDRTERNLNDIRKTQSSLKNVDFGIVKAQVKNMLPSVLNELGLSKKVDADLLVDLIVPIKIASPIVDSNAGRSALKSIVHEALEHLEINREMTRESSIVPHGVAKVSKDSKVLNEGFKRVSNDYGNRSRLLSQIAGDMNGLDHDFQDNGGDGAGIAAPQSAFAPAQPDDLNGGMDPMMNGPEMGTDPMMETGPSADVANSEQLDGQSGVKHLDDSEADAMLNGQPPMDPAAQDPNAMPQMPNEGVGTFSGGNENMVPDASEMAEMPQEGIKRVDQSTPDNVSRQVANLKNKKAANSKLSLFSYAGKISSQLPVQSVKLSEIDRNIIQNHPPINKFAAKYSDNSKLAWNYYLTDSGFLLVSPQNAFHAKTLEAFADFVESDSTFTKWAALPEELQADMPPALSPEHEVNEMAMPEMAQAPNPAGAIPGGEGTPGFNEIEMHHLTPSPDNAVGGGLMNAQEEIFDNSGDTSNPAGIQPSEDDVVETASEIMPHIENMFPEETPEAHQEMAITAALDLLTRKAAGEAKSPTEVGEDTSTPEDVTANDIIAKALKKKADPLTNYVVNKGGEAAGDIADVGVHSLPSFAQGPAQKAVDTVKPYMGVAKPGAGGNAVFNDINNGPVGKMLGLPKVDQKPVHASLIADKAASFMPYINDVYATEPKSVKLAIALEAAYNFYRTAEPAVMEAPSIPETPKPASYSRGGGGAKQSVSGDDLFDMVPKNTVHDFVKGLAPHYPEAASVAHDPELSHNWARGLANGTATVGGNTGTIPTYSMPKSNFDRLPNNSQKAQEKLHNHFNSWAGTVGGHLQKLRDHGGEPVGDNAPASPQTKQKWNDSPVFDSAKGNIDSPMQVKEDMGSGAIPTNNMKIPPDKQRNIDQTVSQLNGPEDEPGSHGNLMEQLHRITPHLNDAQRKQMIPSNLHGLHDNVGKNIKQKDLDESGTTRDLGNMNDPAALSEGIDDLEDSHSRSQVAPHKFQTNNEDLFAKRPVNSEEAAELPAQEDRDELRKTLRNEDPRMKKYREDSDDELARRIQDSQFNHAASANEIRLVTADLTQEEFELSVDALLDLGYSEDVIMAEAERRFAK